MSTVLLFASLGWVQPVFPEWHKVLPEELAISKPEEPSRNRVLGAVGVWKKQKPLPEYCEIREDGRLVGYRLSC